MFTLKDVNEMRRLKVNSKNAIFIGTIHDGIKVLIKFFHAETEKNLMEMEREFACYENLKLSVPMFEKKGGSPAARYIVLEYVELKEVELTVKNIEELVRIVFEKFTKVDPSFLPRKNGVFADIIRRAETLEGEGLIAYNREIKERAMGLAPKIVSASNFFSHHDYLLQNIKQRETDSRIVIFDFDLARKEHILCDLAMLYLDLIDKPDKQELLLEIASQHSLFDQDVFDVLVWKRAIDQVFYLRGKHFKKRMPRPYRTGMETLQRINK